MEKKRKDAAYRYLFFLKVGLAINTRKKKAQSKEKLPGTLPND